MRDFARFHGNPDVATVYDSYSELMEEVHALSCLEN